MAQYKILLIENESQSWRRSDTFVKQAEDQQLASLLACVTCCRNCASRIGLYSHHQTHASSSVTRDQSCRRLSPSSSMPPSSEQNANWLWPICLM